MKEAVKFESDEMRDICVNLNNPNKGNTWKHLASKFGLSRDIYKDFDSENREGPTEVLFDWIFAFRTELTVGQLFNALRRINRKDLVNKVKQYVEQHLTTN